MSEIATKPSQLQGELIIGSIVHGAAINCMVVPYEDPSAWYFQQFPTQGLAEDYAMEHNLVMKLKE